MDPLSLVVMALAVGAAAGLKPTAEQAVRDAYGALKALIKRKYERVPVEMLENDPADRQRRTIVEADLASAGAKSDTELLRQAQIVLEIVRSQKHEGAAAAGVRFDELEAASLRLSDIVAAGRGVDIRRATIEGDVVIEKVRAGESNPGDVRP